MLNLTPLTASEASALAAIASAASIHLQHVADGARTVIAANAPGHWQEQHKAELARAVRLQDMARDLEAAALARERQAGREASVAIRSIEALAVGLIVHSSRRAA